MWVDINKWMVERERKMGKENKEKERKREKKEINWERERVKQRKRHLEVPEEWRW